MVRPETRKAGERADAAPADPEHRHRPIGYVVMLLVGGALVFAAVVTAFLALRAELDTTDAEASTRAAESELADVRAATADLASLRADVESLAADQPLLRAEVVDSWNAVAESVDAALSTVSRANTLFNDGEVVVAKQLLDTEADGALQGSEEDLETLRSMAEELGDAVAGLREILDDSEPQ